MKKTMAFVLALFLTLPGCSAAGGTAGAPAASVAGDLETAVDITSYDTAFTDADMDASWDAASAVQITLSGDSASADGTGVTIAGGIVTITAPGTYVLSGALTDGQVIVNAGTGEKVRLVLNGVSLRCADSAALYIQQADKVFVTLAPDTENSISTGSSYSASAEAEEITGALFSREDLTFNGSGALSVSSDYKHAIVSKDDLVITGGNYNLTAVGDGLRGKDCVKIADGTFVIDAGSDGIQASNTAESARGFVFISGGTFTIRAVCDGIQAETALITTGGAYNITTGSGSAETYSGTESAKGLKAGALLLLRSGAYTVDAYDDAVHADGDIVLEGAVLSLSSGDDGVHADGDVRIAAGELTIVNSYEGIEGYSVTISGGDIHVTAADDGVNAAGGSDTASTVRPGRNPFSVSADSDTYIKITGGILTVEAAGDGLDSNGAIYITGGETYVSGPTDSANGALDCEGGIYASGGIVVAAGAAGMAMGFTTTEEYAQPGISYTVDAYSEAGQTIQLLNAAGEVLASFTPEKRWAHVAITAPGLTEGEVYTLTVNGMNAVEVTAGSSGIGQPGGGQFANTDGGPDGQNGLDVPPDIFDGAPGDMQQPTDRDGGDTRQFPGRGGTSSESVPQMTGGVDDGL